jgi:beta-galactosidase
MPTRERLLMDPQWRFHRGDISFPKGHDGWLFAGNFKYGAVPPQFDDSIWRVVDLPHDFVVEGEFVRDPACLNVAPVFNPHRNHGSLATGVAWYRKQFIIPATDAGRRLSLEFDGVARDSVVWLNQHYLGRHLSGYTGFRRDITDIANYGALNTLAVRVDSSEYEG